MKRITKKMAKVHRSLGHKVKKVKNSYYLMEVHE